MSQFPIQSSPIQWLKSFLSSRVDNIHHPFQQGLHTLYLAAPKSWQLPRRCGEVDFGSTQTITPTYMRFFILKITSEICPFRVLFKSMTLKGGFYKTSCCLLCITHLSNKHLTSTMTSIIKYSILNIHRSTFKKISKYFKKVFEFRNHCFQIRFYFPCFGQNKERERENYRIQIPLAPHKNLEIICSPKAIFIKLV